MDSNLITERDDFCNVGLEAGETADTVEVYIEFERVLVRKEQQFPVEQYDGRSREKAQRLTIDAE